VNQAHITGESLPVDKTTGDKTTGDEVFLGTTNETGAIDVKVTRAGEDTTLGRVKKLIIQAEATQHPIMRLIDRYAGFYTPTVLMVAATVLYFTRDYSRDVSMLEVAKDLNAFVLDKTGTLTTGELSVTRLMPALDVDGAELLAVAGALEQMSRHPVARAIVAIANKARVDLPEPDSFEEIPGLGVLGKLDGRDVAVGRRNWLAERGVNFDSMSDEKYAEPEGLSTLYVVRDGMVLGWIGLEDRSRKDARAAIDQLRGEGIGEIVMITGDRWSVAHRVAHEMGCTEVQAEALPADKLELVGAMREKGYTVAVVGDGVNDAPALAAGDLSIAMGAAGSDVAINSANIALMNNDLKRLPFLIHLSRQTSRVIHQNLIFGAVFIIAFMVGAGLGKIPPILGAVLHMVSASIVIFNSARLVRLGEDLHAGDIETQNEIKPKVEPVV